MTHKAKNITKNKLLLLCFSFMFSEQYMEMCKANNVFVCGLGEVHHCDMNLFPSAFLPCHSYVDKSKKIMMHHASWWSHFYTLIYIIKGHMGYDLIADWITDCYPVYVFIYSFYSFPQVHPIVLTLCHLWTWRESLFLSWEPDHRGATGWRLYSFWSMNRVCVCISECCWLKVELEAWIYIFQTQRFL